MTANTAMTEQTPQQRSAELRRKIEASLAVASAATEGPWHWSHSPDDMLLGSDNRQSYICTVAHAYPSGNYSLDSFIAGQRQHNRDFIATARTVYPAALRAAIRVLDKVDGWLLTDEQSARLCDTHDTSDTPGVDMARLALHDAALSLLHAIERELVLPDAPQEVK